MKTNKRNHQSTINSKQCFLSIVYCLLFTACSFSQGTWTKKADFGGIVSEAAGFSIGTKGYIGTGSDFTNGWRKDFWQWDQGTNLWTQKADFGGTARYAAVGFSIGTKGYIGTGLDSAGIKKDFWEWNQATNLWTQKTDFGGAARGGAAGFSIGSKGYIGTGSDWNGSSWIYYNDFWEWDQTTDNWIKKSDFGGTARDGAVGFSITNKGYVGTGFRMAAPYYYRDFWEWDQATDSWIPKADFGGTARGGAVGFSIGGNGYIGAGADSIVKQDFWQWNEITNQWTQKNSFGGTARNGAVGFSIGAKGYIGTGLDNWFTQDFWEYYDSLSTTSIQEHPFSFIVNVYPNPVGGEYIHYTIGTAEGGAVTVAIYDALGREILIRAETIEAGVTENKLSTATLRNGIYLLKITTGNIEKTQKQFVIK